MDVSSYLKLPEVAQRLGVSEKTARRYIKSGTLPSIFVGNAYRVHPNDLDGFVERTSVGHGVGEASNAPKAQAPHSPPPAEGAEERRIRATSAKELEREISRLERHNERRQRQINEYDQENAPLPEHEWWSEAAASERRLTEEYEERGILGFVLAVAENRMSADWPEQRACVRFIRALSLMRSLVDEAQVMVGAADFQLHYHRVKFRSELSAAEVEESKDRGTEVSD
jgi:excisionase family DNA binding protein